MNKTLSAQDVIQMLGLVPLPEEGGFFKETFRSKRLVHSEELGSRTECTAIYYLITHNSFSGLHAVDQDEIFHFYAGDPVEMFKIDERGLGSKIIIGNNLAQGELPQAVVPKKHWQGTKLKNPTSGAWALLGCTVAPGFELENFHILPAKELILKFPKYEQEIKDFTNF